MQKCFNGIFLIPFFILSLTTYAQQNSVSPYSRLGIGDMQSQNYTRGMSMGGATIGVFDAVNINSSNPASIAKLGLTTFEAGLEFNILEQQQKDPDVLIKNNQSGIRYFAVGVPLTEWWGTALGLQPYSYKGYNISSTRTLEDGLEIEDKFVGTGSLSRLYWGNGFSPFKNFNVGVNTNFIFGSLRERNSTLLGSGLFNSWQFEDVSINGFTFDMGVQYKIELGDKKRKDLSFGLTYTNKSVMSAKVENDWFVVADVGTPIDSLNTENQFESEVTLPHELKFGIALGGQTDQSFNYAWLVSADIEFYKGSEFMDYDGTGGLGDAYRMEVGAYLVPALAFTGSGRRSRYWNIVEYRLGGYYSKTPYVIGNQQISDYGITFGLGLPVRHKNLAPGEVKASTINTGFILGRRGSLDNGLIQESYLNIYLGITLNDKWFIKYKYR